MSIFDYSLDNGVFVNTLSGNITKSKINEQIEVCQEYQEPCYNNTVSTRGYNWNLNSVFTNPKDVYETWCLHMKDIRSDIESLRNITASENTENICSNVSNILETAKKTITAIYDETFCPYTVLHTISENINCYMQAYTSANSIKLNMNYGLIKSSIPITDFRYNAYISEAKNIIGYSGLCELTSNLSEAIITGYADKALCLNTLIPVNQSGHSSLQELVEHLHNFEASTEVRRLNPNFIRNFSMDKDIHFAFSSTYRENEIRNMFKAYSSAISQIYKKSYTIYEDSCSCYDGMLNKVHRGINEVISLLENAYYLSVLETPDKLFEYLNNISLLSCTHSYYEAAIDLITKRTNN